MEREADSSPLDYRRHGLQHERTERERLSRA